jgi:hypothetical protein
MKLVAPLTEDLLALARVLEPLPKTFWHEEPSLPAHLVRVTVDSHGRHRVWLSGVPPAGVAAGQLAAAVRRQSRGIPLVTDPVDDLMVLRAAVLEAADRVTPCPFCQFTPHTAVCITRRLLAGQWGLTE